MDEPIRSSPRAHASRLSTLRSKVAARTAKAAKDDEEEPVVQEGSEQRKARLQAERIIGNPLELAPDYDGPRRRKDDCPAYNSCLSFVVDQKWDAWSCDDCAGPGRQNRQRGAAHT